MRFDGGLRFEGGALFRWAQKQEDGSYELVFERDHADAVLAFDQSAWDAVTEAMAKLKAGQGERNGELLTAHNPKENANAKGKIDVEYQVIDAETERVEFGVEDDGGDLSQGIPIVLMKKTGQKAWGGITLHFSPKAARDLSDLLNRALEAHTAALRLSKSRLSAGPSA